MSIQPTLARTNAPDKETMHTVPCRYCDTEVQTTIDGAGHGICEQHLLALLVEHELV